MKRNHLNEEDLKRDYTERLAYLRSLSEAELQDRVILPLFERQGWKVTNVNRRSESKHRCDVLLTRPWIDGELLQGIQLKSKQNIRDGSHITKILPYVVSALEHRHRRAQGFLRLNRFYWITSGQIEVSGWEAIAEQIERNPLTRDRVTFLDGESLIDQIRQSGCYDLVAPMQRDHLEELAQRYEAQNQGVLAAYYWYGLFKWHLRQPSRSNEQAQEALLRARQSIRSDPNRNLYYWRTIARNLDLWYRIFREENLGPEDAMRGKEFSKIQEIAKRFDDKHGALVTDLIGIDHELSLLQELQPVKYASLSILRTTRMLLRSGVPPSEPQVSEYLDIIRSELKDEGDRSIDGECSLCTGHALSCHSLAGDRESLATAADWLKSLHAARFSWLRYGHSNLSPADHALHYAASVLLGFLDYAPLDEEALDKMRTVFFVSEEIDALGFLQEWVKFRNIDRFEVYRMILATFLHMHFAGYEVRGQRKEMLAAAVRLLIERLKEEADGSHELQRLYAVRENLSSFCLGMVLGVDEAGELATKVVGLLRHRAYETMMSGRGGRRELWDSNLERTQIRVEGLLQYWETLLYLEEEVDTTQGGHT